MAAPTRRPALGKANPPRTRATDNAPPTAGAFIRVYHSETLHNRTLSVLSALEQAEDPTAHREALSSLIVDLTGSALDYCFMKPLKRAKPGFLVEQTANLGLAGVHQIVGPVVRQVIGHMNGEQLLSVSNSLRQFMR
jgi:hypothetical protein